MLLLTPPEQAADVSFLLEEEGHQACFWPILGDRAEIQPGLQAVAEQAHRLTAVIALSRPSLFAFLEALHRAGTRRMLSKIQWLCADASSARTIERQGGVARVPGDGKWTSAVSGLLTSEDEVLVLHDGEVPDILTDALHAAAVSFTDVAVKSTNWTDAVVPFDSPVVIVHSAAAGEAWLDVTQGVTSSSTHAACCDVPQLVPAVQRIEGHSHCRIVSTSPVVSAALAARGVEAYVTATSSAADAVVDAALKALAL